MKKVVLILGITIVSLFANEHATHVTISNSDFIPRLVNFIIFAAILWYLLADKVKSFYVNRSESIAKQFEEVENRLKESKLKKEELKNQIEDAHKKADEIVKTAKEEAQLIRKRILKNAEREVEVLRKEFEEYKKYEKSKLRKEIIKDNLEKLLKDIHVSSEEIVSILTKKVG